MPAERSVGDSLDQRIAQAEMRLVEREHRIGDAAGRLKRGLSAQLQPSRWLPIAAAGAGAWLLWKLLRREASSVRNAREAREIREARDAHEARDAPGQHPASGGGGLIWGPLLTLAWPLAPERWRQSLSPGLLTSAASILSALASSLLRTRRSRARPRQAPTPVPAPTPTQQSPGP